jgi:DNA polymerase V
MNATGFPSPAQGYEKEPLDFNRLLLPHPASTFMMRYGGDNLAPYHICSGDTLIVDCSVIPCSGQLAVIESDGSFICKLLDAPEPCPVFGIVTGVVRVL